MKLNTFDTVVEGHPVYEAKMSKTTGYVLTGLLVVGVAGLIYWKFFRTPKFKLVNKDVNTNRVQFRLDNSDKIYYLDGGKSMNIGKVTITSNLIKQVDSDLIEGIELVQTQNGEVIKKEIIKY